MARVRQVVEKTHLIMQVPYIERGIDRVIYIDRIACGKDHNNVDSTQVLSQVDCAVCRKYIAKRQGLPKK